MLTPEEMAAVEALGGFDKLMETLKQRLAEQKERHQGGNKWIGTAGTSPFGAHGYNPEGVRIGQETSRHRRAVKVWDKREFKDLDDRVELNTRSLKLALRRLRRWRPRRGGQRAGPVGHIDATASNAGVLDLKFTPERAQIRSGAAVLRYRRLHGRPCARVRRAIFRRQQRIQAP